MSDTRDAVTADEATVRFLSFDALRAAHNALLKRHRESGSTPEFLAELEAFIRQGCVTGALLDAEDERWASQSWLDYWSSMMYRAGQEPPDSTLAEFDAALVPELPDALCPYVGLDAFHEVNSNVFFGRERLVGQMMRLLRRNRLLAVVGSSGSGKSSLVRAGLLPALRAGGLAGSEEWHYYPPTVPGSRPLASLVRLIQPADIDEPKSVARHAERFQQDPNHLTQLIADLVQGSAVLVVDQFEELFTLCDDDAVRRAFVDNLLSLVQASGAKHIAVLTMRTDFESLVARLPTFQPVFEEARVRVAPMNAAELREAIEGPAGTVGLRFEPGLVDALLQDILGEPAALPLLQFTLLKLWENRERNRVTWSAYRRLGGGRLALARSADEFYEELIPEEQVTARRILLRMVRPGAGLEVTSNRIRCDTLYQAGEARDRVDRVLGKLVEARLVRLTEGQTLADAQIEVAHEALVRNWPRLVDWLDEERVEMRRRLRLTAAAEQWDALGRDAGALLRGASLEEALGYEDLNELEVAFVQSSQEAAEEARRREEEARQRELQQARERAEEQARAARRLRLALAALAALFLLAVGTGVLVIRQTQENARLAIAATAEAGNAAA
ncbi:MAG: AAA family ATPase, partial [Anaerolineae bacterium]